MIFIGSPKYMSEEQIEINAILMLRVIRTYVLYFSLCMA